MAMASSSPPRLFISKRDKFLISKLDKYQENATKLLEMRVQVEETLKSELLTPEYREKLKICHERLSRLQDSNENIKDYIKVLKARYEPEPVDQGTTEEPPPILAKKRISFTEVEVYSVSKTSIKLKLIPEHLILTDNHEFFLTIVINGDELLFQNHNLPVFIPLSMSINTENETETENIVSKILKNLIKLLECYLIRRENVFQLKKQYLGNVLNRVENSLSFNIVNLDMNIYIDNNALRRVTISLHYEYGRVLADEVRISGEDLENTSVLDEMVSESDVFTHSPLLEAFKAFTD